MRAQHLLKAGHGFSISAVLHSPPESADLLLVLFLFWWSHRADRSSAAESEGSLGALDFGLEAAAIVSREALTAFRRSSSSLSLLLASIAAATCDCSIFLRPCDVTGDEIPTLSAAASTAVEAAADVTAAASDSFAESALMPTPRCARQSLSREARPGAPPLGQPSKVWRLQTLPQL